MHFKATVQPTGKVEFEYEGEPQPPPQPPPRPRSSGRRGSFIGALLAFLRTLPGINVLLGWLGR